MSREHIGFGLEGIKRYSDEWFLRLYLQYGSIDSVIRSHPEPLPISTASYARLIGKHGIIRSAGRHVSFPETLHFFRLKAMEPGTPLEQIYKSMPPSFKTSVATLHRIYSHIEQSVVRRWAAALLIHREGAPEHILVGNELTGNTRYGKRIGDISVPMGFSMKNESDYESVLRVLQQEVFSDLAAKGQMSATSPIPREMMPENIKPFAYFHIVDVGVSLYKLSIPEEVVPHFFSYKLSGHRFEHASIVSSGNGTRTGIDEIASGYLESLYSPSDTKEPGVTVSSINSLLLAHALVAN